MRAVAKIRMHLAIWGFTFLLWVPVRAQQPPAQRSTPQTQGTTQAEPDGEPISDDPQVTTFAHPNDTRYWISSQDNIIFQWHPSFYAKYSGPNSFSAHAENATSHVGTLYLGYELRKTTEVFLDVEEASGGGLSDALGLAGPTNLDVVRNPLLSKAPYVA